MTYGTPKVEPEKQDSSTYHLPKSDGAAEYARLTEQSHALKELMHGNIFHAPITAHPRRILDVGCGTGLVTLELAQKYPEADVYGIDLSPTFTAVSNTGPLPDNLHFIQGDMKALIDAKEAPFRPGSFDYVFSRLLFLGVADWPAHIALLSTLVAKDGYLELQELAMDARSQSSPAEPLPWSFYNALKQDYAALGLDFNAGQSLEKRMKDTPGLVDVQTQMYKSRLTPEGATKEEQRWAKYIHSIFVPFIGMMIDTISVKTGRAEDDRKKLKDDLALEHGRMEAGTYREFWVAWARKV